MIRRIRKHCVGIVAGQDLYLAFGAVAAVVRCLFSAGFGRGMCTSCAGCVHDHHQSPNRQEEETACDDFVACTRTRFETSRLRWSSLTNGPTRALPTVFSCVDSADSGVLGRFTEILPKPIVTEITLLVTDLVRTAMKQELQSLPRIVLAGMTVQMITNGLWTPKTNKGAEVDTNPGFSKEN